VTSYKRLGSIDRSMREVTPDDVFVALETQLLRRATVHSA
jgi:hypothetical protein